MGEQHVKLKVDENGRVLSVGDQDNEIYEHCVLCGQLTDVLINTHIDFRYGYVEGSGQCCRKCYNKFYDNRNDYLNETMNKRRTLITISVEDVMNTPNDSELGEKIRKLCWETYHNKKDEEKKNIWVCTICGKDTSGVDYDYLRGTDHLSCVLNK